MVSEGLIPVVRVSSAREAMEVADAIKEGGVSFIEITMSVQGAIDVIKNSPRSTKMRSSWVQELFWTQRQESCSPCRCPIYCQPHA